MGRPGKEKVPENNMSPKLSEYREAMSMFRESLAIKERNALGEPVGVDEEAVLLYIIKLI